MSAPIRIGALGCPWTATVDERGLVRAGDLTLDWWIGADDRWHFPADAVGVRHTRVGVVPMTETRVRVPSGLACQRVYAVSDGGGAAIVEIANESPAPFVVAFVLHSDAHHGACTLDVEDRFVSVDDERTLTLPRSPARWATAARGSTRTEVVSGAARDGAVASVSGPGVEGAFLFPVPHRTVVRVALGPESIDPLTAPDFETVRRGWERHLDRGMRTELPEPLQTQIDAARADLLLEPPSADAFVLLEAWGFDAEATALWLHLSLRERRRARRRARGASGAASLLRDVHGQLVRVVGDDVALLPGFRPEWLGQPIAATDVPVDGGVASFALRWHGARPALLWDAPAGTSLCAPALDDSWSTTEPAGEALLAAPPAALLAMGDPTVLGGALDAPDSFT
ncbi:MAG: hypothetical protein ACT4OX_01185 [Actinomycetota bacterium]